MQPPTSEYVLVRRDSLPNLDPTPQDNPSAPPTPTPARSSTLPSYVVKEYQTTLRPPAPAPAAQFIDPSAKICQVLVLCQREFHALQEESTNLKFAIKSTTQRIEDTNSWFCHITWIFSLCFIANIGLLIYHLFIQKQD